MKVMPAVAERRAFGRRETAIDANVRIGHRNYACIIRDISEGGALLEFSEPVDLPSRIWLSWAQSNGEIVCEPRHTRGCRIGVQFARPIVLARSAPVQSNEPPAPRPMPPPALSGGDVISTLNRAADLVARHRASLRGTRSGAKVASPEAQVGPPVSEPVAQGIAAPVACVDEIPRDASAILMAMLTEVALARAAATMPVPLIPAAYREFVAPFPLAAAAYAD
jgi:hypothetical protein